jgi:hypothetical protein
MSLRSPMPEEWVPAPSTRIRTRPACGPKSERSRMSKTNGRSCPTALRQLGPPRPAAPGSPPLQLKDHSTAPEQSVRDPEIVDLAAPSIWSRRVAQTGPTRGSVPNHKTSPSLYSSSSTARQSEISFGILDYYTRAPSPLLDSDVRPPPASKIDPAMDQFDFELVPTTSIIPHSVVEATTETGHDDEQVTTGMEQSLVDVLAPTQQLPDVPHKPAYSLFPSFKQTPTPSMTAAEPLPSPPSATMMTASSNITTIPSHQQPDLAYHPRKESLSGSIRSRKDSFTSFRSNRRMPLRLLSSSTSFASTTGGRSLSTASASTTSPENLGHRSHWSDDTTTSPTTPGPRTSFGSVVHDPIATPASTSTRTSSRRSESGQYPACFFDDDEEISPLRKKFTWRRATNLSVKEIEHGGGEMWSQVEERLDEKVGLGLRVKQIILCSGCAGGGTRRRRAITK